MQPAQLTTRPELDALHPGDQVEIIHDVKVGLTTWQTKTQGTVVRVERRRQGLHYRRNHDDKAFSDLIVLQLADNSLTTVTMDEFSTLRVVSRA